MKPGRQQRLEHRFAAKDDERGAVGRDLCAACSAFARFTLLRSARGQREQSRWTRRGCDGQWAPQTRRWGCRLFHAQWPACKRARVGERARRVPGRVAVQRPSFIM